MVRIGQYNVQDGDFEWRYIVHAVYKKTADVAIVDYYKDTWTSSGRYARYPLDLLEEQIEDATFID